MFKLRTYLLTCPFWDGGRFWFWRASMWEDQRSNGAKRCEKALLASVGLSHQQANSWPGISHKPWPWTNGWTTKDLPLKLMLEHINGYQVKSKHACIVDVQVVCDPPVAWSGQIPSCLISSCSPCRLENRFTSRSRDGWLLARRAAVVQDSAV